MQNLDWLHEQLDDVEDDYILFDLPGEHIFFKLFILIIIMCKK